MEHNITRLAHQKTGADLEAIIVMVKAQGMKFRSEENGAMAEVCDREAQALQALKSGLNL